MEWGEIKRLKLGRHMSIEKALMRVVAASKESICDIAERANLEVFRVCGFINDNKEALNESEIWRLRDALNQEDRQKWLLLIR
ncbi:MAG: hypothetical protein F6K35_38510 [Okeania sp. SIO2H7]|nr:hypothetical protein [Okeania sp. SIO2H7]